MTVPGAPAWREHANWDPLIALVGLEVVGCFMWMHELELDDGTRVHAYKNIATRRYVCVGVDGRVYLERSPDRYLEVTPLAALEDVFTGWVDSPEDADAVRALLARRRAEETA
jgi:hypothetical protein